MRTLDEIFNITSPKTSSHLYDAYTDKILGHGDDVCRYLVDLIYEELCQLPAQNGTFTLFRFSGFPFSEKDIANDPVISDIKSGAITFSNPRRFNDPMDPILRVWLKLQVDNKKKGFDRKMFNLMKETVEQIRISCMASPKNSPSIDKCSLLMWAHYAKSHTGVCVQYEVTPEMIQNHCDESQVLRIGRARYHDYKAMSSYITLDNALLAKASDWSYEDEVRLIYFTKNHPIDENGKKKNYITLSGFTIKAVYMGYQINKKREAFLEELCKELDLPLYKMAFNMNDITKLEAKKVDLETSELSK